MTKIKKLSIVVSGRNDNYGGDFDSRLFRSIKHNTSLLERFGVGYEYIFVEWNPIEDKPLLSERLLQAFKKVISVVVPSDIHDAYSLNPHMDFYEMPAKNVGIRQASGDFVLVSNADILFSEELVSRFSQDVFANNIFYRARRIDIPNNIEWSQVQNPEHCLMSGESLRYSPPYYLGAGGDFALAVKPLWEKTTGFNEFVRFTTRAKDWQFFLSVATHGVEISFLGDVYHLEHEEGFRNTDSSKRNSAKAHFGGMWDFEFGLPAINKYDWGLSAALRKLSNDGRKTEMVLSKPLFTIREDQSCSDLQNWLTLPDGQKDFASACILHALLKCDLLSRRLICRLKNAFSAVACSGLARVAAEAGISVLSNWQWPETPLLQCPPFVSEPESIQAGDLILEEGESEWILSGSNEKKCIDIFPKNTPPDLPIFNPLLLRRYLRCLLRVRRAGYCRLALFGAGGHTEELLRWGVPDDLNFTVIFTSWPVEKKDLLGIPIIDFLDAGRAQGVDAIVLSSIPYESEMVEIIESKLVDTPIIPLYSGWPKNFWNSAEKNA